MELIFVVDISDEVLEIKTPERILDIVLDNLRDETRYFREFYVSKSYPYTTATYDYFDKHLHFFWPVLAAYEQSTQHGLPCSLDYIEFAHERHLLKLTIADEVPPLVRMMYGLVL